MSYTTGEHGVTICATSDGGDDRTSNQRGTLTHALRPSHSVGGMSGCRLRWLTQPDRACQSGNPLPCHQIQVTTVSALPKREGPLGLGTSSLTTPKVSRYVTHRIAARPCRACHWARPGQFPARLPGALIFLEII
jgi:hypothetical protein